MREHSALNTAAKAAQLTKAAIDIIKGALSGGLHGAAIGAVKAFAPQLIKAALYIIAFGVMMNIIIFVALPSAMFGFDTATDDEILQMNQRAEEADALYMRFEEIFKSEAGALLDGLSDGYDEIEATSIEELADELGYNWIAAISSAMEQQDLYAIDETSVRAVAKTGIKYSTESESYEEVQIQVNPNTGEETTVIVKKNRLSVMMEQRTAEELMDALGFTAFQKQWAHFMHQNLEEKQQAPVDSDDAPVDYGDITFQNGATEIVYYNQRDARWAKKKYGTSDTIGESGCGPTALAIAVSSLTDKKKDPVEMCEWSYKNGYYIPYGGSYHSLIPNGAARFGLTVEAVSAKEAQKISDALSNGKLVIAIMGKGHFTSSGHFIVLRGITEDGNVLVADPYSINFSNREWDFSIILNEASKRAANNKPFWIISK